MSSQPPGQQGTIVTMPVRELGTVHMDPPVPIPNVTDGLSLTDLPVGGSTTWSGSPAPTAASR